MTILSDAGHAYMRPEDGRLVPLVAIDTTDRADLETLFASYAPDTVGDVAIQWGRREGAPKGTVTLFIRFEKPVELLLVIDFEVVAQGFLVDGILRTGQLYLQGIRSTARTDAKTRTSKIRVVVPDTKFAPVWNELLIDELASRSRALGATERHARLIAEESIRRWRAGPH